MDMAVILGNVFDFLLVALVFIGVLAITFKITLKLLTDTALWVFKISSIFLCLSMASIF